MSEKLTEVVDSISQAPRDPPTRRVYCTPWLPSRPYAYWPWNASDTRKYAPSQRTDAERKKFRKSSLQLYIVLSRNIILMVRYVPILGQDQAMQANN
jgi:hypothetical protein